MPLIGGILSRIMYLLYLLLGQLSRVDVNIYIYHDFGALELLHI